MMFEDFPMYYSFISQLKSSFVSNDHLNYRRKVFTDGWPCDDHMRVLCMHTARVTVSVRIRVSVRKLGFRPQQRYYRSTIKMHESSPVAFALCFIPSP